MSDTVFDVDFTRSLPQSLKDDPNMAALGKAISGELQENIHMSRLTLIYARIDELSEEWLDILAVDLHVDWYDPDSPIEVKRAIIKDSVRIHMTLGTRPAVERVLTAYFGSGQVQHWYEYGGEPHFFRIITDNQSVSFAQEQQFMRILNIVKRKSSWLEQLRVELVEEFSAYFGLAFREFHRETHVITEEENA